MLGVQSPIYFGKMPATFEAPSPLRATAPAPAPRKKNYVEKILSGFFK